MLHICDVYVLSCLLEVFQKEGNFLKIYKILEIHGLCPQYDFSVVFVSCLE